MNFLDKLEANAQVFRGDPSDRVNRINAYGTTTTCIYLKRDYQLDEVIGMRMILETAVKDGRKVQLFRAKDGRLYLHRISINRGEECYYERVPRGDLEIWETAAGSVSN